MRPYPPLGLLYISGYLKQQNVANEVFDSTFQTFEKLQQRIASNPPKVLAIYTNLMTKVNVVKLMGWLKANPDTRDIHVVLGGPDVTYNKENYLNAGADFLVIGEGEETFFELQHALLNNQPVDQIPGLAYQENEAVVTTEARIKIKDLSELPMPNREAVDLQLYLDAWKTHHGQSALNISTQRGCPYTCKWCSTAVYGKSYRRVPAHLVADEVQYVLHKFKPDSLWFVDDVFTVNHKWLGQLHQEFTSRKIYVPFQIITRAERLNQQVLQQLKEMGCAKIWIGAESGSQRIIDKMDRRVDLNTVAQMMQLTQEMGMEAGTFIMVGYPTETITDIYQTVNYLKKASPSEFTITKAYPIKGTALYSEIEPQITQQPNWQTSTDRQIDFVRTYNSSFYQYAINFIVNELNAHQAAAKNNILRASKHKAKALTAKMFMKWHQ
jgi:radical SAM superfamily enzyme YgiQ (UPF0313 family)